MEEHTQLSCTLNNHWIIDVHWTACVLNSHLGVAARACYFHECNCALNNLQYRCYLPNILVSQSDWWLHERKDTATTVGCNTSCDFATAAAATDCASKSRYSMLEIYGMYVCYFLYIIKNIHIYSNHFLGSIFDYKNFGDILAWKFYRNIDGTVIFWETKWNYF